MDGPWGTNCLPDRNCPVTRFEDNFVPKYHLPDSDHYLETLEKKLAKLKKQGSTAKDLLKALSETKESHLERIVDCNSSVEINDQAEDQTITSSYIQRFVAPEKQAGTISELYELIKYDQLGQLFEELNKDKSD